MLFSLDEQSVFFQLYEHVVKRKKPDFATPPSAMTSRQAQTKEPTQMASEQRFSSVPIAA